MDPLKKTAPSLKSEFHNLPTATLACILQHQRRPMHKNHLEAGW